MNQRYSKISPTAVFCARMRAKQNIPFSREIIKLIDTKYLKLVEDLPDYGDTLTSKSDFVPFIEGRFYSINKALEPLKNIFVIEIASGLSPRSLNFLEREDVIYIETELPKLIKIKENIIKDIIKNKNIKTKNIPLFFPLNPLSREEIKRIGRKYLKISGGKKLVIINEGLLMYLNKEEKKIFRDNIRYLFENYASNSIWITTDLSRLKKLPNESIGKENIRNNISKITNREFDYFASEGEVKKFLSMGGLTFDILSNEKLVEELINKKKLEFNKKEILKSAKEYRAYLIQLK